MTGRGLDQVLPHPNDPAIHERHMRSAGGYVDIAEEAHGEIPKPVEFDYIWGEALAEFERVNPDVKLINLETAVTASEAYWKGKGIHYRMHPDNMACITVAGIDGCTLANNHVLDWGYPGLVETLETLKNAGIKIVGAGATQEQAQAPAKFEVEGKGRVIVFGFGSPTSGIPSNWGATKDKPGVNLLEELSKEGVQEIRALVEDVKRSRDTVIVSIHWGGNWGYEIPLSQRRFAYGLIDEAGVDVIHGHSSHHVKGIEVHNQRLILYGCGDFINDYEGIGGYEQFRDDLSLMYFPKLEVGSGRLVDLEMVPTRLRRFRIQLAPEKDAQWLTEVLNREGERLGTRFRMDEGTRLRLAWD